MICEEYGKPRCEAFEISHARAILRIKYETVINGSELPFGRFSVALAYTHISRAAHVVSILIVGTKFCIFIAWNVSAFDELLDGDNLLFAIHVSCHEDSAVVFGLNRFCLGHDETNLCGSGKCTARDFCLALPPEVSGNAG